MSDVWIPRDPRPLESAVMSDLVPQLIDHLLADEGKRVPELQAMEYRQKYLRSPEWRATRKAAIRHHGNVCADCGLVPRGFSLDVHHLTYERLGHEMLDDLVVLCRDCHNKRHGKDA